MNLEWEFMHWPAKKLQGGGGVWGSVKPAVKEVEQEEDRNEKDKSVNY